MLRKILLVLASLLVLVIITIAIFLSGGPEYPPETDRIIARAISSDPPELVTGITGYARSGNIRIWYEVNRPAGKPRATVLLVMGAGTSSMLWPPEFIQAMVKTGYEVIRYDNRGTGMSDWIDNWQSDNPYTLEDMAQDAIAVLDANNIRRAHVVGTSMGGMIGQRLAISHGERVLSLVSMSTSAYIFDPELADLSGDFTLESLRLIIKYAIGGSEPGMIKMMSGMIDMMSDGLKTSDIRPISEMVLYEMRRRRGFNRYASPQHFAAMKQSGSRLNELANIKCPVLVIHGTADAAVNIAHAKKYAPLIPGASTLWLEGAGHIIRDQHMPTMMDAIFRLFVSAKG